MHRYGISWRWHPATSPAATLRTVEILESGAGNSCEQGKAPSFQSSKRNPGSATPRSFRCWRKLAMCESVVGLRFEAGILLARRLVCEPLAGSRFAGSRFAQSGSQWDRL